MGEVYRARDTRLDRTVALKILPPHLADAPEACQRFEREARAISRLSHPHICTLYDVGHQDGLSFLVMECLEGETLAVRLEKGPLPLDELLRIGSQIASALHAAHRHGVVHRDMKPGNIMLTKSGAKLLDFGLAKPTGPAPGATDFSASPTASRRLTAEGSIVGTFQYMAPEQLEGLESDARTDIFALGLVLYQMATGKRAFEGGTQASLIAAILKEDPRPLGEFAPMTPRALDRVVRTCLAKDPDARWQSARDIEIQLKWLEERAEETATPPSVLSKLRVRERFAWAAALLLFVVLVLLAVIQFRTPVTFTQSVRSSLMPPPGSSFLPENFAISPDGTRLAFVAVGPSGRNTLWVRALSAPGAQELNGTEGAMLPFWAPDSRRIGFFAAAKLKTLDLSSGAVGELCDASVGRGGTWNREDTIVFSPFIAGPLYRVPASGGLPAPVTRLPRSDSGAGHRWPHFLPDGKRFLYFADWTGPRDSPGNGIYVGSLDSPNSKLVSSEITGNVAFASGHLLYVRDRRLMAQPFDTARLETTAPAVPIGEQELEKEMAFYRAGFSTSENGMLVFQSAADAPSRLIWFDANGKELGQIGGERLRDPRISPDGRFLAVSSDDHGNGKRFIRVFDLARGVSTRLTEGGIEEVPVWSRDGKHLTYASRDVNAFSLWQVPADGSGPHQMLRQGPRMSPNDWAPDGRLVFMNFEEGPTNLTIYSPGDRQVRTMGPGAEAQLSPDGRWIAYLAVGLSGVTVQPFPDPGPRIRIDSAGGAQPRWSRDGKTIYYIAPDKKLMAVSFDAQKHSAGAPRTLFQTRIVSPTFVLFQYDVSPDGRFLINSFPSDHSSPLTLVTDWPRQLKH